MMDHKLYCGFIPRFQSIAPSFAKKESSINNREPWNIVIEAAANY